MLSRNFCRIIRGRKGGGAIPPVQKGGLSYDEGSGCQGKVDRLCNVLYDVTDAAEVASCDTVYEEEALRIIHQYCEKLIAVIEAEE